MLKIAISNEVNDYKALEKQLLASGIDVDFDLKSTKNVLCSRNFPAEISYMPNRQILLSLSAGDIDVGVLSDYFLQESSTKCERFYAFNNTSDNLCVFIPALQKVKDFMPFSGKRIATNVPNFVKHYFKDKRTRGIQVVIDSCPEKSLDIGIADCFVELESNVNTKLYNTAEILVQSPMVMVVSPKISLEKKHLFLEELKSRLQAVSNAENKVKIEVVCRSEYKSKLLTEIRKIDKNMVAMQTFDQNSIFIQALIDEKQFWDIQHYLKEIQAEKVMVYEVSKLVI